MNEHVIAKPGKDAFYGTDLDEYLMRRKISALVITGVTTEVCVQTTMRCANDRGYDCILVEDGTDSYFPEFKEVTLKCVGGAGRHRRLDLQIGCAFEHAGQRAVAGADRVPPWLIQRR